MPSLACWSEPGSINQTNYESNQGLSTKEIMKWTICLLASHPWQHGCLLLFLRFCILPGMLLHFFSNFFYYIQQFLHSFLMSSYCSCPLWSPYFQFSHLLSIFYTSTGDPLPTNWFVRRPMTSCSSTYFTLRLIETNLYIVLSSFFIFRCERK